MWSLNSLESGIKSARDIVRFIENENWFNLLCLWWYRIENIGMCIIEYDVKIQQKRN